jgi:3-phosphoglycerate kinase
MGKQVGKSLSEPGKVEDAEKIIDKAARTGKTLILPRDAVCSDKLDGSGEVKIVSVEEIPAHMMILDIGPATRKLFAREIAAAKTVFWNGPMGVFEIEVFREGTVDVANAMADVDGYTVVGGGDSLSAVELSGVSDRLSHLSTGGGASLEFLEGRVLPGIACLANKK